MKREGTTGNMEQVTCACGEKFWVKINDPCPDEDCKNCKKKRIAHLRDVNGRKIGQQNTFLVGEDFKLIVNW